MPDSNESSETSDPSGATSVRVGVDVPQPISVFPLESRWTEPAATVKTSGLRRYCHTSVAVFCTSSIAYSTALENSGVRKLPLSNRVMCPFGRRRAQCWWENAIGSLIKVN